MTMGTIIALVIVFACVLIWEYESYLFENDRMKWLRSNPYRMAAARVCAFGVGEAALLYVVSNILMGSY